MAKKYIIIFIAAIFFLGISRVGLCQTVNHKITPTCCPGKRPSLDTEDCLSHCTKQKLNTIKIERHLQDDLKTKTPIFLDNKSSQDPQSKLFDSSLFPKYYLIQIIPKLNIIQIYFLATFNHAPPSPLH